MPDTAKAAVYAELKEQVAALYAGERNALANAANLCALLYHSLPDLNWVGFYLLEGGELILGPFQGRVACVRIPVGKGVCGAAAKRRETVVVSDVHEFPGHIACDPASRSEIVVPLVLDDRLLGVLDLDSPKLGRFDDADAIGLRDVAKLWMNGSELGRCAG